MYFKYWRYFAAVVLIRTRLFRAQRLFAQFPCACYFLRGCYLSAYCAAAASYHVFPTNKKMPGQRPQHANSTYKLATVRCVHLLLPYHFLYRCVLHHLRLLLTSNHQVIFLALNLELIGVIQLLQLFGKVQE